MVLAKAARFPIIIIVCAITFGFVVYGVALQRNDDRLSKAIATQCDNANRNAVNTNVLVSVIRDAVGKTGSLPPADQAARLEIIDRLYTVPMLKCDTP